MRFQALKRFSYLLLIAAMFVGCSKESEGEKLYRLDEIGFRSDTTAILFYECLTDIEIKGSQSSHKCCGASMKLVDVRFNKIYWESKINDNKCYYATQWNDSTMFLGDQLWTIGDSKPQKIDFSQRIGHYNWRPWKNDSILGIVYMKYMPNEYIIIDTKTNTVNNWAKTGEYAWTIDCNDIWWGKNGGICLTGNKRYSHSLIAVSKNRDDEYDFRAKRAMFQYDDEGNIAKEPLFWIELKYYPKEGTYGTYIAEFSDLLGNVTEY